MPHISSSAHTCHATNHFFLQKTRHNLELTCKDLHLPKIICQSIDSLSSRELKHVETSRLVIIDSSACAHGCSKKTRLHKVAIDVKRLSKQLEIDEKETLSLLKSPHVFEKLALIAYAKTILDEMSDQLTAKEAQLPLPVKDFKEKVLHALILGINHNVIGSEKQVLDAFSPTPTHILMAWCPGDKNVKIGPVMGNSHFKAVTNDR